MSKTAGFLFLLAIAFASAGAGYGFSKEISRGLRAACVTFFGGLAVLFFCKGILR